MHRVTDIKVRLDSVTPGASCQLPPDWPAPAKMLWCDPVTYTTKLANAWTVERHWDDPFDALDWMAGSITDHPWPAARWVGFLSYDLGRLAEPLLAVRTAPDD